MRSFLNYLTRKYVPAQKVAAGLLAMLFTVLIAPQAFAQLVYSDTTAAAITDNNCGTAAQITRTFTVPTSVIVTDVNFGFFVAHTYRSDLRITLRSPAGTTVTLLTWTGNVQDGDNYNDLLDDQAAAAITTHNATVADPLTPAPPPYSHTFKPSNPLSAFNGQNAQGAWTMVLCDGVGTDVGTYNRADLYINTAPAPITVTKTSSTISDGVSASNPKSVPGAITRYCILVTNTGTGIANAITATDIVPANLTFVPGSMRSGASCTAATIVEDDDAVGADESDPIGASITGATVNIIAPALTGGSVFAFTFNAVIN